VPKKPFQFLLVNVLREYLARDLGVPTPFPCDKERLYDDFGGWAGQEGQAWGRMAQEGRAWGGGWWVGTGWRCGDGWR